MLSYQPTRSLRELITGLRESVDTDKIFLLGITADGQPVNSIFNFTDHGKLPATGYFLLLLTRPGEKRTEDTVQDMLEQRYRYRLPVHLIVYPARTFYQWLQEGQSFAVQVIAQAPLLYDARATQIPPPGFCLREQKMRLEQRQAEQGFHRSAEFLAGAELFSLRQEYNMAAFLLHQCAEHAFLSFMLQHTGLRTGTHNLDKLIRYSTMVSNLVNSNFPRSTERDVELFRLLQKAYIHSRYKDDYFIDYLQISTLINRMKKLLYLLHPGATAEGYQVQEEELPWPLLEDSYSGTGTYA